MVRPPPRRGGPAPGFLPCAACFLVLLAPSLLDFPQRFPEKKRLGSPSAAAPTLVCRAPDRAPAPARQRGGGRGQGPAGRGGRKGGKGRGSESAEGRRDLPARPPPRGCSLRVGRSRVWRPGTSLPALGGGWRTLRQPDIPAGTSCSGLAAGSTVPEGLSWLHDSRTALGTEGCGLGDPQWCWCSKIPGIPWVRGALQPGAEV